MIVHAHEGSMHVFILGGFLMEKKARLTTCMISSSFRLFLRSNLVLFVVWFLGYQGLRMGSMAY